MKVKCRINWPFVLVAALVACGAAPDIAAASENAEAEKSFVWTKGMGVSYPLVASVSGGLLAPLFRDTEKPGGQFGTVALQASVDLGIGGGMVSGGLFIPVGMHNPAAMSAISVKAATLRTWDLDIGAGRNRTYKGAIIEYFDAAGGMGGKIGLGYFRTSESKPSPNGGIVYLYVGFGL